VAGFEAIIKFLIPPQVLAETLQFLRVKGKQECEGLVLWVGIADNDAAQVQQAVVPKQIAVRSRHGLSVHVAGETLHDLNVWLYEKRLRLLAQVHSHGEHAYHSETDNEHSIVTALGALSVVVPYFGNVPCSLESFAFLRLSAKGWIELSREEVQGLIDVR
jgi:Prokaryotic homologs of the JAB domain